MGKALDELTSSEKMRYLIALFGPELERANLRAAESGVPAPPPLFPELEKAVNASEIRTLKGRDGREFIPPTCQVFDLEKKS